jgi:hypothetical protein
MHYRVLSDVEDFQARFASYTGLSIPIEYFRQSIVTGAFDDHGVLVGGWVTAPGRAGRWLSQIPDVGRTCGQIAVERTIELNGVWLAPALRGRETSAEFWRALARDLSSRDVDHVMFGVNMKRRGLARLYESMALGVAYEGPIIGSTTVSVGRYFHSSPRRFAEIEQHYAERLLARSSAGQQRARKFNS